jgi:protein-L-isoaspartate(D-aspartate) O-methyltransferase
MMTNYNGMGMTSQRARDRLVEQLRTMGIRSIPVLEALRTTPRHLFIDEALASRAYDNTALPIGYGQTISQPYVVARMSEVLLNGGMLRRVLEIGTGSAYQTAILAQIAQQVYSVERIEALYLKACERILELGYTNVHCRHGDGSEGWQRYAPYDGILVAAAPVGIPQKLRDQLDIGGRLIIPVGQSGRQQLLRIDRTQDGFLEKRLDLVSFVPMLEGVE